MFCFVVILLWIYIPPVWVEWPRAIIWFPLMCMTRNNQPMSGISVLHQPVRPKRQTSRWKIGQHTWFFVSSVSLCDIEFGHLFIFGRISHSLSSLMTFGAAFPASISTFLWVKCQKCWLGVPRMTSGLCVCFWLHFLNWWISCRSYIIQIIEIYW